MLIHCSVHTKTEKKSKKAIGTEFHIVVIYWSDPLHVHVHVRKPLITQLETAVFTQVFY